jgi:hypothetical protein
MNKVIVTTTINSPTEALRKFAEMPGWHLVVVMDKRTPSERLPEATYLTCEDQDNMFRELSEAIGWNCIQRRNLGFAYAIKMLGADIIATVDDDNIPLPGWGENLMLGRRVTTNHWETEQPLFDPVWAAGRRDLWHRGFPMQLLQGRDNASLGSASIVADIQADFWNGDPDIDAVCRMEHAPEAEFDPRLFPITSNRPGPFNSQNTFFTKAVAPSYFMFPEIGRMDDIWASYHVQAQGFKVVYGAASVFQKRNQHNLTRDLRHEWFGYTEGEEIAKTIGDADCITRRLPTRALRAFNAYQRVVQ